MPLDLPIARAVSESVIDRSKETPYPRWLEQALNFTEVFGHTNGVILILIGVFVIDRRPRAIFHLACATPACRSCGKRSEDAGRTLAPAQLRPERDPG